MVFILKKTNLLNIWDKIRVITIFCLLSNTNVWGGLNKESNEEIISREYEERYKAFKKVANLKELEKTAGAPSPTLDEKFEIIKPIVKFLKVYNIRKQQKGNNKEVFDETEQLLYDLYYCYLNSSSNYLDVKGDDKLANPMSDNESKNCWLLHYYVVKYILYTGFVFDNRDKQLFILEVFRKLYKSESAKSSSHNNTESPDDSKEDLKYLDAYQDYISPYYFRAQQRLQSLVQNLKTEKDLIQKVNKFAYIHQLLYEKPSEYIKYESLRSQSFSERK